MLRHGLVSLDTDAREVHRDVLEVAKGTLSRLCRVLVAKTLDAPVGVHISIEVERFRRHLGLLIGFAGSGLRS